MISTYADARAYLEELIKPIPYAKKGTPTTHDPLDRMRTLLRLLDNPQNKFRSIQVSGTSGKGSTTYLISHLLTAAGYKTGLTLSPHLLCINERFQINETMISDTYLISLVNELVPVVSQMKELEVGEPTYFEALMSLAFLYFARENVDIAVVEVGLEGRYDGTNTLNPLLFVLTNISLDHVEYLGDTVEKIAKEAVSAIKPGIHVISGVTQPSVVEILLNECVQKKAACQLLARDVTYTQTAINDGGSNIYYQAGEKRYADLHISLRGEYQGENTALALTAVLSLKEHGFVISETQIRESLQTAAFAGRLDNRQLVIDGTPIEIILDGAHNPAKMKALVQSLLHIYPNDTYISIFACKQHKDIAEMSTQLSIVAHTIIATTFTMTTDAAKNASMSVLSVEEQLKKHHPECTIIPAATLTDALQLATKLSRQTGKKILVTGSLYLVGETLQLLNEREKEKLSVV